jgi:hypothetical protein
MPQTGWSPTTVPSGPDEAVYLVIDRFVGVDVYRETEVERTDRETVIADLLAGQFNDPVRVIAFNTNEQWSKDVSGEIACELQTRCDLQGERVPNHLQKFIESRSGTDHTQEAASSDDAA